MPVSQKSYLQFLPIFLMMSLIIWLSCISQPTFHSNYTGFLNTLPLPEALHRFLAGHYKLGHPFCYFLLTVITAATLRKQLLLTILLTFTLGASLELVQYFLPTRAASFVDLGYNLVGILFGAGIVWGVRVGKSVGWRL